MKIATKIVLAAATMAAASVALANSTAPPPVSVPEPGSMALLVAGVAGAVAALRNRRK